MSLHGTGAGEGPSQAEVPSPEGHHFHFVKVVGHELVSLVPLALRKGIIPETRSVSFLIRAGLRDTRLKYPFPSQSST